MCRHQQAMSPHSVPSSDALSNEIHLTGTKTETVRPEGIQTEAQHIILGNTTGILCVVMRFLLDSLTTEHRRMSSTHAYMNFLTL